jgi:hypothetical protein
VNTTLNTELLARMHIQFGEVSSACRYRAHALHVHPPPLSPPPPPPLTPDFPQPPVEIITLLLRPRISYSPAPLSQRSVYSPIAYSDAPSDYRSCRTSPTSQRYLHLPQANGCELLADLLSDSTQWPSPSLCLDESDASAVDEVKQRCAAARHWYQRAETMLVTLFGEAHDRVLRVRRNQARLKSVP